MQNPSMHPNIITSGCLLPTGKLAVLPGAVKKQVFLNSSHKVALKSHHCFCGRRTRDRVTAPAAHDTSVLCKRVHKSFECSGTRQRMWKACGDSPCVICEVKASMTKIGQWTFVSLPCLLIRAIDVMQSREQLLPGKVRQWALQQWGCHKLSW